MGQQSRGSGNVTLVFFIESQGTGDMVGFCPLQSKNPVAREQPMGRPRPGQGEAQGLRERERRQSQLRARSPAVGPPRGLRSFSVCWKASRTRWLLPNLRSKGEGPQHRGCDAGQARVWACLAGMGASRGSLQPPRERRRQETPREIPGSRRR